jgi:hypothetical protein
MQTLGLAWSLPAPALHEIRHQKTWPAHRGARQLLATWQARQGEFVVGRDVPSRALARLLSGLALFQPILNGDFRVRLAGQGLRRCHGRDVTAEKLSDIAGADFPRRSSQWREIMEMAQPLIEEARLTQDGHTKLCYETVALRVRAPDAATPWIMTGVFFHDWRL